MGSSRPRSESDGVYDLLVGLTGLFGSIERSLALMLGALFDFAAGVTRLLGPGSAEFRPGARAPARSLAQRPVWGPAKHRR